ncbi:MAG: c-type cytochrome [Gemmatimonadaceae bacterium]|nr:c-type cytochrome [Gemmatimonadaceae bacterium]
MFRPFGDVIPSSVAPRRTAVLVLALVIAGCERPAVDAPAAATTPATKAAFSWEAWTPPALAEVPDDSLGRSIRRGLALLQHTTDSLPAYAHSNLQCTSCHLNEGREDKAAPLTGTFARFPKYMPRTGAVITVEDRVNYCFTRSLAGNRIPTNSREMTDIVNYLAFLSRGVPVGTKAAVDGLIPMPNPLTGDPARGEALFREKCVACHGQDGGGAPAIPALWGPKSFSIGASMAREERAASFIWRNMPLGQGGTLTEQQAFDVAAFMVRQPRPDSPNKEQDWPGGGAPKDVPYRTDGHEPYVSPRLLPRRNVALSDVPKPPRTPATPGAR